MDSLEGYDRLLSSMRSLPEKLQRQVIRKSIRAGASSMRKTARANAPKRSGALDRNIIVASSSPKGKLGKVISSYAVGVDSGKVGAVVDGRVATSRGKSRKATRREKAGEDPFYWVWQETGYQNGPKKVPGKKFLEKALKMNQDKTFNAVRIKLKQEIDKTNGR